jgi:hypothetical protein
MIPQEASNLLPKYIVTRVAHDLTIPPVVLRYALHHVARTAEWASQLQVEQRRIGELGFRQCLQINWNRARALSTGDLQKTFSADVGAGRR